MGFWKQLRFWLKDTFQSRGDAVKTDSSLSRTISDATHTRGGGGQGGGLGPSEEAIEHALKGHENYQKSFKKNR
jgi:hypothetical protein